MWRSIVKLFLVNTTIFITVGNAVGVVLNYFVIGAYKSGTLNYIFFHHGIFILVIGGIFAFITSFFYNLNVLHNILRYGSQDVDLFNAMLYSMMVGMTFLLFVTQGNADKLISNSSQFLPFFLTFPLSGISAAYVVQLLRKHWLKGHCKKPAP